MAFSYADMFKDPAALQLIEGGGQSADSNIVSAIVRLPKRDLPEMRSFVAEAMRRYQLSVARWNAKHRGEEFPRFMAELDKANAAPVNQPKVTYRPRIRVTLKQRKIAQLKEKWRRQVHGPQVRVPDR